MSREYASFLLRCWRLDGDERRIKIECMQSGEGTQVTTLADAVAWLSVRWADMSVERVTGLDRPLVALKDGDMADFM